METATAEAVLYLITVIALVVWLVGLRFLAVSARGPARPDDSELKPPEADAPRAAHLVTGHAEVEGRPAELAAKAAALLARDNAGVQEQVKILQRTEERVVFEGTGQTQGGSGLPCRILRGEFRFMPLDSGRTAVDYAVAVAGSKWLLRVGGLVQVLGLVAIVVGFWLIRTYVVAHPNPAVRGQALQMLQVVHFLWPPFLFAGLYRMGRRAAQARFDVLAHNLPYYGTEAAPAP